MGLSRGGNIVIQDGLSQAERFLVLVHEAAHELLHKGERRQETTKTVRETEPEAVAYVVSRAIGLEPATASSDYIQLYRGTAETLSESLDYTQRTASTMIETLTAGCKEPLAA